jgi:hypothetical protein
MSETKSVLWRVLHPKSWPRWAKAVFLYCEIMALLLMQMRMVEILWSFVRSTSSPPLTDRDWLVFGCGALTGAVFACALFFVGAVTAWWLELPLPWWAKRKKDERKN